MADISKLILPSGDEYNYKDAYAREFIQNLEPDLDGETSTVTGDIVTFETESAQILPSVVVDIDPVQDLHGYDHPWPAGGGKNLFLPMASGGASANVSFVRNADFSVTFTGKSNGATRTPTIGSVTLAAGSYVMSGVTSGSENTFGLRVSQYVDGSYVAIDTIYSGETTFTLSEEATIRLIGRFSANQTEAFNVTMYPMIRLASETDPSFAPYSNICPISGWTGCNVRRTGKNLIPSGTDTSKGFIAGKYPAYDGTYIANAAWNTSEYFKLKPNTVYCYSNTLGKTSNNVGILFYDSNYNFIGSARIQNAPTVFTTPSDAAFAQTGIYVDTSTNGFNQIELGSTATTYEPYSGTTYSISFPSSAGTVYGGTLDVTNGILTVDRTMVDLGTLTWQTTNPQLGIYWLYKNQLDSFGVLLPSSTNTPINAISSRYKSTVASVSHNSGNMWYDPTNSARYFGIKDMNYANVSVAEFAEAMKAVTFVFALATPVTYQLTPTQVTALLGQNNIWADTGDSTVIYRTGKLALLSDVADSEERVREDLNNKIDSLTATDVGAAKDSSIAPVEPTSTASNNYAVGDHLMLGGVLYEVTVSIASGETITQGTNVTPATVMESVVELDTRLSANIQLASEAASIGIPYEGVDLTVKFASEIAQYADPWAWIKARITEGDWSGLRIGDYIPFTTTETSPKTYQAQIAGINTYKSYGDTAVGKHIDFICRDLWATRRPVNPVNFNNGTKFGDVTATEYPWLASDLYLYLNSLSGKVPNATTVGGGTGTDVDYTSGGVYYYLPAALKAQIVEKMAYLPKRYDASSVLTEDNSGGWTNIGKLWLPSEFEVYGAPVWGGNGGYAIMGNNVQYPIFANNMNRVNRRSGGRDTWWVISVHSGSTTTWCYVNLYGVASKGVASNPNVAVPVCFRIA